MDISYFCIHMSFSVCLLFTSVFHSRIVRASDKRIACDEEFSDSEDEGDGAAASGGRRHRENFRIKRLKTADVVDGDKKEERGGENQGEVV